MRRRRQDLLASQQGFREWKGLKAAEKERRRRLGIGAETERLWEGLYAEVESAFKHPSRKLLSRFAEPRIEDVVALPDLDLGRRMSVVIPTDMLVLEHPKLNLDPEEARERLEPALEWLQDHQMRVVPRPKDRYRLYLMPPTGPHPGKTARSIAREFAASGLEGVLFPDIMEFVAKQDGGPEAPAEPEEPPVISAAQWGLDTINAPDAWLLSEGESIRVAVIDSGIETSHVHFGARVEPGYNSPKDDSDPTPRGNETHGTHCAGVVLSGHSQAMGVAPKARLVPVRALDGTRSHYDVEYHSDLAHAIDWAWEEGGADVISLSWTTADLGLKSEDSISCAIYRARLKGRPYPVSRHPPRGCIIIAAAGNDKEGAVAFPARLPGVVAVGYFGINQAVLGAKTNKGPKLDVCAPGELIGAADLMGDVGDSPYASPQGDVWWGFGETSAATAHVAGIAALMLSANPDMKAQRGRDILKDTSHIAVQGGPKDVSTDQDDPSKGWGWGKVDAHRAVKRAMR